MDLLEVSITEMHFIEYDMYLIKTNISNVIFYIRKNDMLFILEHINSACTTFNVAPLRDKAYIQYSVYVDGASQDNKIIIKSAHSERNTCYNKDDIKNYFLTTLLGQKE